MASLRTFWRTVRQSLRHRFKRVAEHAKCPACGYKHGRIRYSDADKCVAHECFVCGAKWGDDPVVDASSWTL